MIDKVFPRKLNSSKDARVRGKDEMIEAVNVTIDDNYDDFSNDNIESPSGNFGVLKPVKGNTAVPNNGYNFNGNGRVIGSCVDERNNAIYYFVASSQAAEHGVYVYRELTNDVRPLITSSLFNFSPESFVESNVVYVPNSDGSGDVKPILFFTDNINEPRKIDILRASDGQSLANTSNYGFLDFISTCPRTPVDPPIASFQNDAASTVSNFKGKKGFQFAYQNIYKSGDVSALSTYSKLYVPSAYIQQGTSPNASFFNENYLAVQIPQDSLSSEVDRIRLLTREGNDGSWFIVDEIDYSGETPQYDFYNDSVLTILPEAESRRQFDNVPKKARAQEVTNNRLFFGNYVEGFNAEPIRADIAYESIARPEDFITFDLQMEAEVRNTNFPFGFNEDDSPTSAWNRVASYRLRTSDLPATVDANTQIIFTVSLNPDNNFHFYESRNGYHGSARYNMRRPEQGDFVEELQAQNIDNQLSQDFDSFGQQYFGTDGDHVLLGGKIRRSGVCHNPYFENNTGSSSDGYPTWRGLYDEGSFGINETGTPATYGTNAGNPFIVQGKTIKFSGSFVTLADLSREEIAAAIRDIILPPVNRIAEGAQDVEGNVSDADVFTNNLSINVLSSVSTSSYVVDLGLNNLDKIKVYGGADPKSKLVVAVGDQQSTLTSNQAQYTNPMGYFIVNKAQPEFRLRDITSKYNQDTLDTSDLTRSGDIFFALDMVDLGDYEVLTCVPDVQINGNDQFFTNVVTNSADQNIFDGWVCMTPNFIQYELPSLELTDFESIFSLCPEEMYDVVQGAFSLDPGVVPSFGAFTAGQAQAESAAEDLSTNIRKWLGFLVPEGSQVTIDTDTTGIVGGVFGLGGTAFTSQFLSFTGGRIINTYHNYCQDAFFYDNLNLFNNNDRYFDYAFSLLDGEAGAGGQSTSTANGQGSSSVSYQSIICGVSPWCILGNSSTTLINTRRALNNMPLIFLDGNSAAQAGDSNNQLDLDDYKDHSDGFSAEQLTILGGGSETLEDLILRQHAHIEIFDFETTQILPSTGGESLYKSFKTKANHDFGIVYYDERGRASDVVPIGSVYIPSYNLLDEPGPVKVQINLDTQSPPSWAWSYQIVYGGNSTVSEFVQYTTGGAFVEFDSFDPDNNGNIYVSLNYLQNNSSVSYSKAFGAVKSDGNQDFYTFKEGDKLRVLSYFEPLGADDSENDLLAARTFPDAYEFDIVGTATFADDDENPLINPDEETPAACVGQFVILRNNPSAVGFTYKDVLESISNNSPQPTTGRHLWNNGCVVELYSPRKNQDAEDRVYYEIGKEYRVIRSEDGSGNLEINWENPNIVLNEGDVYFRRVPVNIPRFNRNANAYENLIKSGGGTSPRFLDYFLETETFTDTIVGAKQHNWGKPKIVNRFQREIRRDSSITFGDVNNYSLPTLRYGTFDATTSNFKDLPNTHGSIQKIVDRGDSIFIVQENKISDLPVSRTTLSDQAGNDIVVASTKVLGNQRFYSGDFGCSTNPESVTKVGENIYFANKEKFEVYKFNPANGVAIISEYGLKSYFYQLFKEAIAKSSSIGPVRVVGGYDPVLDEFILSVHNDAAISVSGVSQITQETSTQSPDPSLPSAPTEAELQQEIDDLQSEVADLENVVASATDTINTLQDFINDLYVQVGNVVTTQDSTYQTDIDNLQAEIDDANDQIEIVENSLIGNINSTISLHGQVLSQALIASNRLATFIGEYQGELRAEIWQGGSIAIPTDLDSTIVGNAGFTLGQVVNLAQYLQIASAYQDVIGDYLLDDTGGLYNTNLGTYTRRNGDVLDFEIAYGIPTDDSIAAQATTGTIFPADSALGQDPDFLTDFLGTGGNISVPGFSFGYRNQVNTLINSLNQGTFDLQNVRFEEERSRVAELEVETTTLGTNIQNLQAIKLDLLEQISAFVNGIYNAGATRYDLDNLNDPTTGQPRLRIFGEDYSSGAGDNVGSSNVDSPLLALRNAANEGLEALEAFIVDGGGLEQAAILDLIEDGLFNYQSPLSNEFTLQDADLAAIQATRDVLANNLYQTSLFTFQLQESLFGQSEYSGEVSEAFFNLLATGGAVTAEEIITALGGQALGEAQLGQGIFQELGGNVGDLSAILTGIVTEEPVETGISENFRQRLADTLTILKDIQDTVGFIEVIDDSSISDILNPEFSEANIASKLASITGVYNAEAGDGDLLPTLALVIQNIRDLGQSALQEVIERQFFDPLTLTGTDYTALQALTGVFGNLQNSGLDYFDQVGDLQTVANNVGEAIDELYRFQIILGSQNEGPFIGSGIASDGYPKDPTSFLAPVNSSRRFSESSKSAVGYTSDQTDLFRGITASDVLSGRPTYSGDQPSGFTSFESFKSLIGFLNQRAATYAASQDEDGDIELGFGSTINRFYQFYPQEPSTPFIFGGDIRDLIPSSVLAEIVTAIIDESPGQTGVTNIDSIKQAVEAVANYVYNLSVVETVTAASNYLRNNAAINNAEDVNQDGSVTVTDILQVLTAFGTVYGVGTGGVGLPSTLDTLGYVNPAVDSIPNQVTASLRSDVERAVRDLFREGYQQLNYDFELIINNNPNFVNQLLDGGFVGGG